jgi:hypothetical protein
MRNFGDYLSGVRSSGEDGSDGERSIDTFDTAIDDCRLSG